MTYEDWSQEYKRLVEDEEFWRWVDQQEEALTQTPATRTYQVVLIQNQGDGFQMKSVKVTVEAQYMGLGEQDAVEAIISQEHPDWQIADSYPLN